MTEDSSQAGSLADEESSAGAPAPTDDSLIDDVRHLVDDGKTYLEAELQYQKSRAAVVLDRGRSGAIYGGAALALLHLALVALVVGLVIALAPLITAWGATALVAIVLATAALVLALAARRRFAGIAAAVSETRE